MAETKEKLETLHSSTASDEVGITSGDSKRKRETAEPAAPPRSSVIASSTVSLERDGSLALTFLSPDLLMKEALESIGKAFNYFAVENGVVGMSYLTKFKRYAAMIGMKTVEIEPKALLEFANALNIIVISHLSKGKRAKQLEVELFVILQMSADWGCIEAIHNLGLFCLAGIGVAYIPTRAEKYFRKAAEAHCGPSEFELGLLHINGIKKDLLSAFASLKKASSMGVQEVIEYVKILETLKLFPSEAIQAIQESFRINTLDREKDYYPLQYCRDENGTEFVLYHKLGKMCLLGSCGQSLPYRFKEKLDGNPFSRVLLLDDVDLFSKQYRETPCSLEELKPYLIGFQSINIIKHLIDTMQVEFQDNSFLKDCVIGSNEILMKMLVENDYKIDKKPVLGASLLHSAAIAGSERIVQFLLEAGLDPDFQISNSVSPLMCAARQGHVNIVKLLYEWKANICAVSHDNADALSLAADCRTSMESFIYLVTRPNYQGRVPSLVKTLTAKGNADALIALRNQRKEKFSTFLVDVPDGPCSVLFVACEGGHENIVDILLDENVPELFDAPECLWVAMSKGHIKLIKKLANRIDINRPYALYAASKDATSLPIHWGIDKINVKEKGIYDAEAIIRELLRLNALVSMNELIFFGFLIKRLTGIDVQKSMLHVSEKSAYPLYKKISYMLIERYLRDNVVSLSSLSL